MSKNKTKTKTKKQNKKKTYRKKNKKQNKNKKKPNKQNKNKQKNTQTQFRTRTVRKNDMLTCWNIEQSPDGIAMHIANYFVLIWTSGVFFDREYNLCGHDEMGVNFKWGGYNG